MSLLKELDSRRDRRFYKHLAPTGANLTLRLNYLGKNAAENPRRLNTKTSCATLRSCCVHAIELLCQSTEVRVKRDKAGHALKESLAAGVVRHAIQRALAEARRQLTAAG